MANHLKSEHSPYLQQHADNPVHWYPWGEEAFEKAQKENKAIFLSIGYSSCHWCHVMERESFEDPHTASLLNEHFIAIKVDKEERPDIDRHFQEVYQLMNKRPGGWPLSIFLTQERKPFYSATYIPDEPRYGMMSFSSLLEIIADKYTHSKEKLTQEAEKILSFLNPQKKEIQATKLDNSIIARFTEQATQLFDSEYGGFNKAPKFPQVSLLMLLMDIYRLTGNQKSLHMALYSLESMAKGGLRDIVEGGFCRYATDDDWLIPHFEKMTYDNAQLTQAYLKAYHITKEPFYKEVAQETLSFMLKRMSKEHLFFSASDADTEQEEGKYFIYTYQEALEALQQTSIPSEMVETYLEKLHITKEGSFEGANIVRISPAKKERDAYEQEALQALLQLRHRRTYPFIDTKVILSWNAMMITALFQMGRIDEAYLIQAQKSLDTLLDTLYIHGQLFHSTLMGKEPKIHAFLEDYAYLVQALIEAYESTLDESYLILAQTLANQAIEKYFVQGKWKFSRGEFETEGDIYDSSYPSAVATMLEGLHSISSLIDPVYKKFLFRTLEIYSYDVMRQPISTPTMSKMVIRYLLDDIVIKAKPEMLSKHITQKDTLPYPFTLLKAEMNEGFMLCNSSSCFGHEGHFKGVESLLLSRQQKVTQ